MTATGTGRACCHHGEILQGVFLDADGRRQAGLVTLPLRAPVTHATFVHLPTAPPEEINVGPEHRPKACRAARVASELCAAKTAQHPCGGTVTLYSPLPVGLGMGSSTSDMLATVRAVADSFRTTLTSETVARLIVDIEQACDPLMLDQRPVLFAQRQGHVLETLGNTLPPAVVLGCVTGHAQPVDTVTSPATQDSDDDLRTFEHLREELRRAIARSDVRLLGRVSTASARQHQQTLPTSELDTLIAIAEDTGAAGVQIAHSGNVAGLLFDIGLSTVERRLSCAARMLEHSGLPTTGAFTPTSARNGYGRTHQPGPRPTGPGGLRQRAGMPAL